MNVLVINCGSSSLKFQLIDMEKKDVLAKGICDKIGLITSILEYKCKMKNVKIEKLMPINNHNDAIKIVLEKLIDNEVGPIKSLDEIKAIGHRVAQGGEIFKKPEIVTNKTIEKIESLSPIAPLHNPGAVIGIQACMEVLPDKKNVVVFDTSFHQTMPEESYLYAIPEEYYTKYGVRKYGFHGTSYKYTLEKAAKMLGKEVKDMNCIICHLGGGASVCAIKNGESYDTSMGLTPLGGLVMGTRCGDIDPAVVTFLMEKESLTIKEINEILNKKSGMISISKTTSDARELVVARSEGNEKADLALRIFAKNVKKFIGGYMAELGKLDCIVMTGGIGEHNFTTRSLIFKGLEILGIEIDEELNKQAVGIDMKISKETSKHPVYIIPTNEEIEIATETLKLTKTIL